MSFPYHKQHVSPLTIEMAVWYATRCEDYHKLWPTAQARIIEQFAKQGIVRALTDEDRAAGWTGYWRGTDKCRAWVELMCKTPFPIEMWVDPRTEEMV